MKTAMAMDTEMEGIKGAYGWIQEGKQGHSIAYDHQFSASLMTDR